MVYQTSKAQERRQLEIDAGLISERYPQVRNIHLEVEFRNSSGKRVQLRCRDLPLHSYAIFEMKCPLDDTPFDLQPVVEKMISAHKRQLSDEVMCSGSRSDSQHVASYNIKIQYLPRSK